MTQICVLEVFYTQLHEEKCLSELKIHGELNIKLDTDEERKS